MEPLFFVVAILGCGDGAAACSEARVLPARYETAAQCRAALPQAIADNTDVPYPSIGADCRARGMQMAKAATGARRRG
jgi:hypothetical protein